MPAAPLRRRNAPGRASSASDYAPPAEPTDDVRPRRGRVIPSTQFKYIESALQEMSDDELFAVADHEGIDPSIEDFDEIFNLLVAVPAQAPEPEAAPARRGRGRAAAEEPAEEVAPARGRGRRAAPAEDEVAPARGRGRTNTADSPASDSDDGPRPTRTTSGAGFKAFNKERAKSQTFERPWKPALDTDSIVKFLDPENFDSYAEHNLFDSPITKGQRTFVCLAGSDVECPLCAVGSDTKAKSVFNVIVIDPEDEDDEGTFHVMEAGPDLAKQVEDLSSERALNGDLRVGYASMSAYKKDNGFISYKVKHIKERDLQEDWSVPPLSNEEITEFDAQKKGPDYVQYSSLSRMNEAADAISKG